MDPPEIAPVIVKPRSLVSHHIAVVSASVDDGEALTSSLHHDSGLQGDFLEILTLGYRNDVAGAGSIDGLLDRLIVVGNTNDLRNGCGGRAKE
jgi:hypothetical protein